MIDCLTSHQPPGASSDSLTDNTAPASPLVVAHTLRSILGLKQIEGDGFDLQNESPDRNSIRYHHFYDQKGGNCWVDEVTRFRIADGEIPLDRMIPLLNNPKDF